jgi:hypothetical protein
MPPRDSDDSPTPGEVAEVLGVTAGTARPHVNDGVFPEPGCVSLEQPAFSSGWVESAKSLYAEIPVTKVLQRAMTVLIRKVGEVAKPRSLRPDWVQGAQSGPSGSLVVVTRSDGRKPPTACRTPRWSKRRRVTAKWRLPGVERSDPGGTACIHHSLIT